MQAEDMIMISVDDHVVEPPSLFEGHIPARYRDQAPKVVKLDNGTDVWKFGDATIPNIGLNAVAGRPKEEYGVEPASFDEIRPGEGKTVLVTAHGTVVTRSRIVAEVWGRSWPGANRTLDVHVATLCTKLGRAELVATVRGARDVKVVRKG